MGDRRALRDRGIFWVGPAFTAAALGFGHVLWKVLFPESSLVPGAAFAPVFLAAVVAAFLGGRGSGLVSAALATVYVAVALIGAPDVANLAKASLTLGTLVCAVLVVGRLKERADANLDEERAVAQRERRNVAEARHAIEVLQANNETLETFVYVITHDLKEPVRAIEFHARQAQEATDPEEARLAITEALETNRRLGILLQRLLEYSRASLTAPTPRLVTIDDILDDAVCRPIYEHTLRTRKAELAVQSASVPFMADPTLLGQAVGNLVLNAIKHNASASPRVAILVRPADTGHVELVLQDNGPGFPVALLQRFHRLKANRPATLSGGFGLMIARRAVERLGGTMALSNLTSGAEVRIRLPAARSPEAARVGPVATRVKVVSTSEGAEAWPIR